MRMIQMALILSGLALGASSYAQQTNDEVLNDDAAVYLFNEGDQPMDEQEAVFFPTEDADSARTYVRCSSHNYRMTRCRVNGRIQSVRLVRRTSFAPCVAGRTFGATTRYIWVSRGCSGQFLVRYNRGHGGWGDDDHGGHGGHH